MQCADYQHYFSPYIDQQLAVEQRALLEDHLRQCLRCRTELASLQSMMRALHEMDAPTAPDLRPGVHEKLAPQPWWRALSERFAAPWPASLPLHGAAVALTALLVVAIVSIPHWLSQPTDRFRVATNDTTRPREDLVNRQTAQRARPQTTTAHKTYLVGQGNTLPAMTSSRSMERVETASEVLQTASINTSTEPALFTNVPTLRTTPYARAIEAKQRPMTPSAELAAVAALADELLDDTNTLLHEMEESAMGAWPAPPIQVSWRVSDPATAVTYLTRWLEMVDGILRSATEEQMVFQLHQDRVGALMRELTFMGRAVEQPFVDAARANRHAAVAVGALRDGDVLVVLSLVPDE